MSNRELSYTQAINEALKQQLEQDPTVFIMGEDVGTYGGAFGVTKGLIDQFGKERVRDTPISENAIISAAIGAAIQGLKPVVEIMFSDFMSLTMDPLVNTAAKVHYMYGGQMSVPLVLRTASGSGTGAGAQHSQSLEAWLCHVPGLKVVSPSTPAEAKGLLVAAIQDPNPVIFLEPKSLYNTTGPVPEEGEMIPLGKGNFKRMGGDLSLISYGSMVPICLAVAEKLAHRGVDTEVLDLRTLAPLDRPAIIKTAIKTGRVAIIHEACKTGGLGGEIAAIISESEAFNYLKSPIIRICGADTPMPFAPNLEAAAVPTVKRGVKGAGAIFLTRTVVNLSLSMRLSTYEGYL